MTIATADLACPLVATAGICGPEFNSNATGLSDAVGT